MIYAMHVKLAALDNVFTSLENLNLPAFLQKIPQNLLENGIVHYIFKFKLLLHSTCKLATST
jgi:hypothetical protein